MTDSIDSEGALNRSGPRRLGDNYQDIVTLELLINWLEHSDRYRWVRVEARGFGALDDVAAERSDGTIVARQVKFSTNPESESDRLTWDWLLKREAGKRGPKPSLLMRWASSLADLRSDGKAVDAALISNRQAGPDLSSVLRPDRSVDFDALPQQVRKRVQQQLGDEPRAREFFGGFKFCLNEPNRSELMERLHVRFARLGGTDEGWQSLVEEVAAWVCFRDRPSTGGVIALAHIKLAARWRELQSLPQRFEIPVDYVPPSAEFHESLIARLLTGAPNTVVLTASPGSGKSTYTSKLFDDLRDRNVPVVRHHYFLSLTDESPYARIDHRRAAESLMNDLQRDHAEALGDHTNRNPNRSNLGEALKLCGEHYASQSQRLILIIDGLDHVWREKQSTEELNQLFGLLFPLPRGVSLLAATQPVDDAMLPASLLRAAPRSNTEAWLTLPPLGMAETEAWIAHHLHEFADSEDAEDGSLVAQAARAFHESSRGHPLHLQYTLRTLRERDLPLSEVAIRQLPPYPHKDIVDYYEDLWRTIPEEAREILHLLSATDFVWPRIGTADCLDPGHHKTAQIFAALKQVGHLLRETELGLQAFHGSLLAFIRKRSDHDDWALSLKHKALDWLRGPAPEYWRWAYEWRLAAILGNVEPLLRGPDRAWTVEAVSRCRPSADVEEILGRSLAVALERHEFPRAIELGLLLDYYAESQEPHWPALAQIYSTRMLIAADATLDRSWLRDHIEDLSDEQVAILAEADARYSTTSHTLSHFDVLNERLRSNKGHQRISDPRDAVQRVAPILAVAALPGGPPQRRITRFAVRGREEGDSVQFLSTFAHALLAQRDVTGLRALLDPIPTANDGEEGVPFTTEERDAVVARLVLSALEQGADCDEVVCMWPMHPWSQIYAAVRGMSFAPGDVVFPATSVLNVKGYQLFRHKHEMDALFVGAFFAFLANHLWERPDDNPRWVQSLKGPSWPRLFLERLDNVASEVAAGLHAKRPPTLGEFYHRVSTPPRPESRGHQNHEETEYGVAGARAAMVISLDLVVLLSAGGASAISRDDLRAVFGSTYCIRGVWIERYIARRRQWLDDEALDWLLTSGEQGLAASLGQFPDRAEQFAQLAAVAALHEKSARAEGLLRHAAENMLAHGFHKDYLFHDVLGAISAYHREVPLSDRNDGDRVAQWVRQLAPAVAKIMGFTDGDDLGHLPRSLADIVAQVALDRLPAYYQWLADEEEYEDAQYALKEFVRTADLNNPTARAIAETATDYDCLQALVDRSRSGYQPATEILDTLSSVMGKAILAEPADKRPFASDPAPPPEKPALPPFDQFPPEKLADFLSALEAVKLWPGEEIMTAWAKHWSASGRGKAAYDALKDAAERGRHSAWDTIYALAVQHVGRAKAYPDLLRAFQRASGWSRIARSLEHVSRYWDDVKAHYPDKSAEFLGATLGTAFSREVSLEHHKYERLVQYCARMKQPQLAGQLVEAMVKGSLELVSPLRLDIPPWAAD